MSIDASTERKIVGEEYRGMLRQRDFQAYDCFGISRTSGGSSTIDLADGDIVEVLGEDVDAVEVVGGEIDYEFLAMSLRSQGKNPEDTET